MKSEQANDFNKVGHYSPGELNQFREIFATDLKRYRAIDRRYAYQLLVVFLVGVAALACGYLLPSQPPNKWLLGVGIVLIAGVLVSVAVAASSLEKQLKCPACHNLFIDDIGEHCPECGSASLARGGAFGALHCNSCGKKLITGKNRSFRYKACTHCGVFLDEKGL
jgi:RNA polymerase subunit RPABC4/transcription elongation factor Spt4